MFWSQPKPWLNTIAGAPAVPCTWTLWRLVAIIPWRDGTPGARSELVEDRQRAWSEQDGEMQEGEGEGTDHVHHDAAPGVPCTSGRPLDPGGGGLPPRGWGWHHLLVVVDRRDLAAQAVARRVEVEGQRRGGLCRRPAARGGPAP